MKNKPENWSSNPGTFYFNEYHEKEINLISNVKSSKMAKSTNLFILLNKLGVWVKVETTSHYVRLEEQMDHVGGPHAGKELALLAYSLCQKELILALPFSTCILGQIT